MFLLLDLYNWFHMPRPSQLVKPLKPAPVKWSKKERLTILAFLLATFFIIALFYLKGQGFNFSPQTPSFSLPSLIPETRIVIDAPQPHPSGGGGSSPSPRPSPVPTNNPAVSAAAKAEFARLTSALRGTYGFYVFEFASGNSFGTNHQTLFPAASLMKLPVLIALYQSAAAGQINLDSVYTLQEKDKVAGAGSLQYAAVGTQKTFRELAKMMGQSSDNTAYHIVATLLRPALIQKTITEVDMSQSAYQDHTTTPADIGLLLQKLYRHQLLSPANSEEILNSITHTDWEELIPTGIPPGIRVAHKYASDINTWSDAAIVYSQSPFILVISCQDATQKQAFDTIPLIAKSVYQLETQ